MPLNRGLIASSFVIITLRPPFKQQIQFDWEGKNTYKLLSSPVYRETVCYWISRQLTLAFKTIHIGTLLRSGIRNIWTIKFNTIHVGL